MAPCGSGSVSSGIALADGRLATFLASARRPISGQPVVGALGRSARPVPAAASSPRGRQHTSLVPVPAGAGTDSHGPMDHPNIRLTGQMLKLR